MIPDGKLKPDLDNAQVLSLKTQSEFSLTGAKLTRQDHTELPEKLYIHQWTEAQPVVPSHWEVWKFACGPLCKSNCRGDRAGTLRPCELPRELHVIPACSPVHNSAYWKWAFKSHMKPSPILPPQASLASLTTSRPNRVGVSLLLWLSTCRLTVCIVKHTHTLKIFRDCEGSSLYFKERP